MACNQAYVQNVKGLPISSTRIFARTIDLLSYLVGEKQEVIVKYGKSTVLHIYALRTKRQILAIDNDDNSRPEVTVESRFH